MSDMVVGVEAAGTSGVGVNPTLLGRGLAVLRIFVGIILFANGLAKIAPELGRIDVGWYHGNLITRPGARGILNFEVNERQVRKDAPKGTKVPGLKWLTNEVLLKHWGFFQWPVTLLELGAGLMLIVGFATRGAALATLSFQLFLAAVYFSSNRWMFEQPHEYIPPAILAVVPAGRYWGVDAWIVRQYPRLRRWPF